MPEELKNSFKKLEELQEEEYSNNLLEVKKKVDGNLNSVNSFMNIIDVYFSKLLGYFVTMSGGDSSNSKDEDKEI